MIVRQLLAEQRIRYVIAAGWNTLFGFALFVGAYALLHDEIHYLVLLVIAQIVATLNAFASYRWFVFRVRGHFLRDLIRFSGIYVVMLAANLAALPLMVEVAALPVLVAQAVLLAGTIVGGYLLHGRFSFRRIPDATSEWQPRVKSRP